MTKLVTLSGAAQAINPEIANINPAELSNFDAGIVFFKLVSELYPGITWGELWELAPAKMSGWWTDLKNSTGDIYDSVRGVVGDVKDGIGDVGGSTIRLIASDDVSSTVTNAIAASQGKQLPGQGAGQNNELLALIGSLFSKGGEEYKKADIPPAVIYGGAAALAAIVLLAVMRK